MPRRFHAMPRTPVVAVVAYHNEERYLPALIASLRAQRGAAVPVVFVDNASTDGSAALLRRCDEVHDGLWMCIEEPRVGKFFAMRTAAAFAADRFDAGHVAFLDADSYCADDEWLANGVRLAAKSRCGYAYSPLRYFGAEHLPTFVAAYNAYETVLNDLIRRVGWLANGMGFLCAADVLRQYFESAQVTTEMDLRLSLLALCERRAALLNPSMIMSSARRIVVNRRNLEAWCFYDPAYYWQKDINTEIKLDLNAPAAVDDLHPDMVAQFFQRRSLKLASHHLAPLVIFDSSDGFLRRLSDAFGADIGVSLMRDLGHLRGQREPLLSNGFEVMIARIAAHPACMELGRRIASLMQHQHTGGQPCCIPTSS